MLFLQFKKIIPMKNRFLVLLFCVICSFSMAQSQLYSPFSPHPYAPQISQSASLAVETKNFDSFWLYLNGEQQNVRPISSIRVTNLVAYTFYKVRLVFSSGNRTDLTIDLLLMPEENAYTLTIHKNQIAMVHANHSIIAEMTCTARYAAPVPPQPGVVPPPVAPNVCNEAMFQSIKQMISKETFEVDKLELAKQSVSSHPMTASQIAEIAQLLTFEQNRLEFLIYAYRYCINQNRYEVVMSTLTFSSSKDELRAAIHKWK